MPINYNSYFWNNNVLYEMWRIWFKCNRVLGRMELCPNRLKRTNQGVGVGSSMAFRVEASQGFFSFLKHFIYYIFSWMYVCAPGVDLVTKAVRRECQIHWDWSNRCCELLCVCAGNWTWCLEEPVLWKSSALMVLLKRRNYLRHQEEEHLASIHLSHVCEKCGLESSTLESISVK